MKRILTCLLSLVLLISLMPAPASAADDEKLIAITFDDGPSKYTAELLDGLAECGAKVTFFIVGRSVSIGKEVVKRAWEEGHQIASHTWDHPYLPELTDAEIRSQLSRTDQALDNAIGVDLDYILRPPYGGYTERVLTVSNLPSIIWSMSTSDYNTSYSSVVYDQIMETARDGAICCLHDTHYSTVKGALRAIKDLQEQGYQCVTVKELFYRRGRTLQRGVAYRSAYPGSAGTADALSVPQFQYQDALSSLLVTVAGDPRSELWYTTNGELPTPENSTKYTGPISVTGPCILRAVGVVDWNGIRTETVTLDLSGYSPANYLYDVPDPAAGLVLNAEALKRVSGPDAAAAAVRSVVSAMSPAQKSSATGSDLLALYAEAAASAAGRTYLSADDVLISADTLAEPGAQAHAALSAVSTTLEAGGVSSVRELTPAVIFSVGDHKTVYVQIDPSVLTSEVRRVRVESPSYALTIRFSEISADLTRPLVIILRKLETGTAPGGAAVSVEFPGNRLSGAVTLSFPSDGINTDTMVVTSVEGAVLPAKYNPATRTLDARITASGRYGARRNDKVFSDIGNKSAEMQTAIRVLAAKGIVNGTGGSGFAPDAFITRAQFTALIVRLLSLSESGAPVHFSDVSPGDWYSAVVSASQKAGLIRGYSDNTFHADDWISKEQIAVVTGRVLRSEMGYRTPSNINAQLSRYKDGVSAWARQETAVAAAAGLLADRSDGNFAGGGIITRGDATVILYRLYQRLW